MNANDRSIVGVTMLAHAMVHTYELSVPVLMTVWLSEFAVSKATLGVVVAAGYALFGLGSLPGGVLADSYGSKRLIVVCLVGMGASFLVLGAATNVVVIAAALVLWGVAASVYHPSGLSLISTGVEERGTAFAYHGIAGNAGIGLGPFVTTVLLVFLDWRVVVVVLGLPALVTSLYALRTDFDESAAVSDGGRSTPEDVVANSSKLLGSSFTVVFGVVVFSGLYYRGILTFLPDMLSALPAFAPVDFAGESLEPARYLYSGLLMVGMAGQYVGGKLTDAVRVEKGIVVGYFALALVALGFVPAMAGGLLPVLAVSALLGFFLFAVQPIYQATVAEHTPPGTRGLSYGYTYLGTFGVGALGAVVTGVILTYANTTVLFAVLASFGVAASVLGVWLTRYVPRSSP